MKLLEYAAHVAVNWCIAAVIVAGAWSFVATRHKARARRAGGTRVAKYPPPVPAPVTPPFSQTAPDVSWFRDIPSDCLGDDAIRLLAEDIAEHFHVIDGAA